MCGGLGEVMTSVFRVALAAAALCVAAPAGIIAAPQAEAVALQGSDRTIYEWLSRRGRFSEFVALIDAAGMAEEIDAGEFTLFAPNNNAFSKLTDEEKAVMLADPDLARACVERHMLSRPLRRADGGDRRIFYLNTMAGNEALIMINRDDSSYVDGARIQRFDIEVANGVIHTLRHVMAD